MDVETKNGKVVKLHLKGAEDFGFATQTFEAARTFFRDPPPHTFSPWSGPVKQMIEQVVRAKDLVQTVLRIGEYTLVAAKLRRASKNPDQGYTLRGEDAAFAYGAITIGADRLIEQRQAGVMEALAAIRYAKK